MNNSSSWLVGAWLVAFGFVGCGGSSQDGAGSDGGRAGSGGALSGGASSAGTTSGGGSSSAGQASTECSVDDCGPQLGLPNWTCDDGSTGGPTGRCLKKGDACGWEIRECPATGEGGAGGQAGQAGLGGMAGETAAGGASSREACGGCPAQQICVYQSGGPGPGRFLCADQNPCGAAGACACIVGQGTCQQALMGEPPNTYCTCDNGLD